MGDGQVEPPSSISRSSPVEGSPLCLPLRWSLWRTLLWPHCFWYLPLASCVQGWDIHKICLPTLHPLVPSCHVDPARGLEAFSHLRQISRHLSWRQPGITLALVGIRRQVTNTAHAQSTHSGAKVKILENQFLCQGLANPSLSVCIRTCCYFIWEHQTSGGRVA